MAVGRVVGVDACPGGWVGNVVDRDRAIGPFAPTLAELVGPADDDLRMIAIDIPIGLPDRPLAHAKGTRVGARRRRELCRASGIVLDEVGPAVGSVGRR